MIEARDITLRVREKALLSDVSVLFEPGLLHLLIGPNGAGKSTLVKVLSGFLKPQEGEVTLEGRDIRDLSDAELSRRRAVLSQAVEVAFPLTVREVVMMGRYPHFGSKPREADERIVDEMMELFDVTDFRERNYQTLSGGERQRVNFARVLAQLRPTPDSQAAERRYLFLDEPLTFLDIRHQIGFMKKIRAFALDEDVVTVGVVHDLDLAARFADRIVLLDNGRVVSSGAAGDVLTVENIKNVFDVDASFVKTESSGMHLLLD